MAAAQRGTEYSGEMSSRATITIASATRSGVSVRSDGLLVAGKPSVGTYAGLTAVTSTPRRLVDTSRLSENATTPCLLAEYTAAPGTANRPASDATLMTWPRPRSSIPGRNTRVTCITPRRFTRTTSSIRSWLSSTSEPPPAIPALFTRTSTGRPVSSVTRPGSFSTRARSVTSHVHAIARPPACSIRAARASSRSFRRATRIARAPYRANAIAVASPIPDDAPVTTTFASRRSIRVLSLRCRSDADRRYRSARPPSAGVRSGGLGASAGSARGARTSIAHGSRRGVGEPSAGQRPRQRTVAARPRCGQGVRPRRLTGRTLARLDPRPGRGGGRSADRTRGAERPRRDPPRADRRREHRGGGAAAPCRRRRSTDRARDGPSRGARLPVSRARIMARSERRRRPHTGRRRSLGRPERRPRLGGRVLGPRRDDVRHAPATPHAPAVRDAPDPRRRPARPRVRRSRVRRGRGRGRRRDGRDRRRQRSGPPRRSGPRAPRARAGLRRPRRPQRLLAGLPGARDP